MKLKQSDGCRREGVPRRIKVEHQRECRRDYVRGARASMRGGVRIHNLGKREC